MKIFTTRQKNREIRHAMYGENAISAIGKLEKNCNIFGLCKGQFSIINIIEAVLLQTGAADVILSTWTAANYDIEKTAALRDNGFINKITFILDRSAATKVGGKNFETFNNFFPNSVFLTNTHCKFVLIKNKDWNIAIRTSMNLNENKRLENFEISDCKHLYNYLNDICLDLFKNDNYSWSDFQTLGMDEKYDKYINNSFTKEQKELRSNLIGNFSIQSKKFLHSHLNCTATNANEILNSLGLSYCTTCGVLEERFTGKINGIGQFTCKNC